MNRGFVILGSIYGDLPAMPAAVAAYMAYDSILRLHHTAISPFFNLYNSVSKALTDAAKSCEVKAAQAGDHRTERANSGY